MSKINPKVKATNHSFDFGIDCFDDITKHKIDSLTVKIFKINSLITIPCTLYQILCSLPIRLYDITQNDKLPTSPEEL